MRQLFSQSVFCTGKGLYASLALLLVFVGTVGLDQVTKFHAQRDLLVWEDGADDEMYRGRKVPVARTGERLEENPQSNFFLSLSLQYSRNKGAAFSMLSQVDDSIRVPLFYFITLIAVVLVTVYLRSTPLHHYLTRFGLVMILSGAIGNFLDRLIRGYVIDFVDVEWNILGWQHDFAIFNVADISINIGVGCLLVDMILHRKEEKPAAS